MAKKFAKPNKSQMIREYAQKYPEQSPKQISEAVSELLETEITNQYVSTVLHQQNKKKEGKPEKKPEREGESQETERNSLDEMDAAIDLLDVCGSQERAEEILQMVAYIRKN